MSNVFLNKDTRLITKKVNVLGTEYTMKIGKREELNIGDLSCGSCLNYGDKVIKVVTDHFNEKGDEEANEALIREVIVHELAHAFLYESGLVTYSDDEVLVNWLSVNARKLVNLSLEVQDDLNLLD